MTVFKRLCVLLLVSLVAACSGGNSSSPASPSAPAAASGTRVIGLSGILAFGNVVVGQSASATFTITNTGNTTLNVSSLTLPSGVSGAYSASFTSGAIAAGASQTVNFKFSPTAAQDYGGTLTVNGDQTGGTNTLAVSGVGVLGPGVAATRIIGVSGNLAFGNVAVGQTGSATFTITNSGNSTLTITNMTVSACASDYSASWTSGTVLPGASQQVTVFFKPQAAQACNATVTVVGDQTSGTNTIGATATGSGTSPAPAPSPSTGGKYDGNYFLSFQYGCPGGPCTSNVTMFIRNGVVSSSDGLLTGNVDNTFGKLTATSPCPLGNGTNANWTGIMNVSSLAGSNFGQGTYACTNPSDVLNWTARQTQ